MIYIGPYVEDMVFLNWLRNLVKGKEELTLSVTRYHWILHRMPPHCRFVKNDYTINFLAFGCVLRPDPEEFMQKLREWQSSLSPISSSDC